MVLATGLEEKDGHKLYRNDDASSTGVILKGDGKGNYSFVPNSKTGMIVKGEVKDIIQLHNKKRSAVLFIKNNNAVQVFKRNH